MRFQGINEEKDYRDKFRQDELFPWSESEAGECMDIRTPREICKIKIWHGSMWQGVNPIALGCILTKDENRKPVNATSYKQIVGSLMLILATRPDLSYSICLVTRYMERPTFHLGWNKEIFQILEGNCEL